MSEKIIWGTGNLKEGFSFIGQIISARWDLSKDFGKGVKNQLVIEIKPFSIEGKNRLGFYTYSDRKNSKWGRFNDALEHSGMVLGETFSEKSLVGAVFEWTSVDIEFGEMDGEKMMAKGVLLPDKFMGIEPVTDTSASESEYKGESHPPQQQDNKPTEENKAPVNTEPPKQEVAKSLEMQIIEVVKSANGVSLEDIRKLLKLGDTDRGKLYSIIGDLVEQRKLKMSSGILYP